MQRCQEWATERVRRQVQSMDQASDFEGVLSLLAEDLKSVDLSFDTCCIDALDEPVDNLSIAYFEEHDFRYTIYTIDPEGRVTHNAYLNPLLFCVILWPRFKPNPQQRRPACAPDRIGNRHPGD